LLDPWPAVARRPAYGVRTSLPRFEWRPRHRERRTNSVTVPTLRSLLGVVLQIDEAMRAEWAERDAAWPPPRPADDRRCSALRNPD